MIDIHNHILINTDDGPSDKSEMLNLLKQAVAEGVTDIVATPHHLHPKYDNEISFVKSKVNELNNMSEVRELGINIYTGQEIRASDQILQQLESGEIEGINNSQYLLIELPSNRVPHFVNSLIYELQIKGYTPIIAHPERNKEISKNLDKLFELINIGALSQITAESLVGKYGKHIRNISLQMIENNLAHFVASDAHDEETRPFYMKSLLNNKKIKKHKKDLLNIINNSECIIRNKTINKVQPLKNYQNKKWFSLFS